MILYHVGCAVADLDRSMRDVGSALGLDWSPVRERPVPGGRARVVYSLGGPTHVELLEGSPGTPWHVSGAPVHHHMGYWTDDLAAETARLLALGFRLEHDLGHVRYLCSDAAPRIELVSTAAAPELARLYGLTAPG
ncbi:hypothetical protein GIS00_01225 [Nakamurella sp. YIM 132087]|uniref:VOC family protein n=1 Tax=Nakamurella alba TaxID=2665158 RepID=A0A7K1FER6_9ACTN|nr:VOC family protein [Nakamurella alba]MTD12566.1 hypothetical protein [Nakamurella alba]